MSVISIIRYVSVVNCAALLSIFTADVYGAVGLNASSSPSSVEAGGSTVIQSSAPATFQLQGSGTLVVTSPTTAVYTAPDQIPAGHVLSGCQVLPSDSVFNTRIDGLPVASASATEVPFIAINRISISYQWGTNVVTNATPATPQKFFYTPQLNGTPFPIPALTDMKREQGAFTRDGNNDHHLFIVNHESCTFYETYQQFAAACVGCTAQSGWTYSSTSYNQPAGGTTDAAGLPLGALTLHLSEIKAGVIKHALRFTGCLGCISRQSLWPATGSTGAQPGAPPMGARFRLKSSYNISSYPPAAQIVLTALKQYGMFLADIGTTGEISASSDVTEDASIVSQLQSIANSNITPSAFDIVDESSLMLSPALHIVNPNNGFVQPANEALVNVSNSSGSVAVPIALVPVTVGTVDPTILAQAGTSGFTIPAWVNGTTDSGLTWSITPSVGAGTVDNSGVYTPPANVAAESYATITATSVADPSASMSIAVTIIPQGPIDIDSGSAVPTSGAYGTKWIADVGFETGSYAWISDGWPSNAWGNIANLKQFQTYMYNWGDDLEYRLHLPNGNYVVTFLFGVGSCTSTFGGSPFDNGLINGPLHFQVQDKLVLQNFDPGVAINHTCRTPAYVAVPAVVTDTSLRLNLRATGGWQTHSVPLINGLQIQSYGGAAYLSIVAEGEKTSVAPGASLQLDAVNWFGDASEPLAWTVAAGSGSIDQNGLYTASSSPATDSATIQVQGQTSGRQASITLQLSAASQPGGVTQAVQFSGSAMQFGTVAVGQAAVKSINVTNPASAAQTATISLDGPGDFSIAGNTCQAKIAPGGSCTVTVQFSPSTAGSETARVVASTSGASAEVAVGGAGTLSEQAGLQFVPITPCRAVDTRIASGGPAMHSGEEREFDIESSPNCHMPSAAAYALNVTAIPHSRLGYLTVWPSGSPRPPVSTLNSWDGRIKANAVLIGGGANGAVSAYATDDTDLVMDVTGYFVAAGTQGALDFYALTPCRILDTRTGGQPLRGVSTLTLDMSSTPCSIGKAQAYSLNITAIPHGPLGFVTAWPAGDPMPNTSVLNSWGGQIVANAAIIPAGNDGAISLYSSNTADLVIDINGYYAPHGDGGLAFYPEVPCRAFDSRVGGGSAVFKGERTILVGKDACPVSRSMEAVALNATVIPSGALGYLSLWAKSENAPNASTLNSYDGTVVSNLAVLPTESGSVRAFLSDPSALVLDLFGIFAPY